MIRKTLLSLALLLPLAAQAASPVDTPARATVYASQDNGTSLEAAAARVQREHGGRILSAETVTENGRRVHLIKVLTPDNNVRTVRVNANGN